MIILDLFESSAFGSNYAEQLAQQVFDENPNLDTTGQADEVMDAGFAIAREQMGSKRAQSIFAYDEDFPSDFVSAYAYLQQGGADHFKEGWKGELVGGTVGGIAGNLAGTAIAGPWGGLVGGAAGGAGGGIIGRELTKEEQLNEFAPLLAAGARLVIAMAPKIAQVLKSTGQATARAAAPVAKSGAEIAAKNAGQIGLGLGAYEIGSSVAEIAKEITAKVGTALEEKTIMELAQVAFKFAIPAGIVLAILYGGKKVIDSLFSDSKEEQGVAEGGAKDRQWSNKDMERLRVATRDFDDIMASDGPEAFKQELIKKRIQTKPIAGPKGVLPEQDVAKGYNSVERDYEQWEQALYPHGNGASAFDLIDGDETTIRNILTYVKQNRAVLGYEVSPETGRTVKDAIIDIRNEFPQLYQAAQQPQSMSEQGVDESLADDFAAFAKERGGKIRYGQQPDKPVTAPAAPRPAAPVDRDALTAELKKLQAQLDPNYQYSDDHSFWSKQDAIAKRIDGIKKQLDVTEAQDEKIGNMPADKFDAAMARLKQLAGAGPLKTVYDPATRRYKNVPVDASKSK
jgi:hypothetical protein